MKSSILLIPAFLVFFACQHPAGQQVIPLQLSAIYDIDSVQAALGGNMDAKSAKKLGQAIDLYKNKNNPAASIAFFKDAILSGPSAKAYFELGGALLEQGNYDEATQALHIAEQLNYSPLANVMFKLAAAYAPHKAQDNDSPGSGDFEARQKRDSLAEHYMQVAIQMGYAHPEQFLTLPQFSLLKESYSFRSIYNSTVGAGSGGKGLDKTLWQTFLSDFPQGKLPMVINTAYIQEQPPTNSIGYEYEKFITEMRNAKFSREVEDEYYYCALIKTGPAYTALLYAGKNQFVVDGKEHHPVFYLLATFDAAGKIIDKMAVAGQKEFTASFKVFSMQPNYSFTVQDYNNVWQYDPVTAGYDSNYVVRSEPAGSVTAYIIGTNGRFEKQPAALAMR